jgi:putative transposase
MPRDTTVIAFRQPEAIDDPLTEVAREGARRMLAQVLIAEAASFIAMWKDLRLPDGRDRVVHHGRGRFGKFSTLPFPDVESSLREIS